MKRKIYDKLLQWENEKNGTTVTPYSLVIIN